MMFAWEPRDGETIHIRAGNRWHLPAARYRLHRDGSSWRVTSLCGAIVEAAEAAQLTAEEQARILTPLLECELDRERRAAEPRLRHRRPVGRWVQPAALAGGE